MIWLWSAILVLCIALVVLDTRRINRKRHPVHEADARAAAEPNGHVDIVGGGFRVR